MPIPVIVIFAIGLLSALWPAPELERPAPPPARVQTFQAEVTIPKK